MRKNIATNLDEQLVEQLTVLSQRVLDIDLDCLPKGKSAKEIFAILNNNSTVPELWSNVCRLVEEGANVNLSTETGITAAYLAVATSDVKLINFLLDKGADINATLLHNAAIQKNMFMVFAIINRMRAQEKKGGENKISHCDRYGNNALHYLLERFNDDTVILRALIGAGVNLDAKNEKNKSPREMAEGYSQASDAIKHCEIIGKIGHATTRINIVNLLKGKQYDPDILKILNAYGQSGIEMLEEMLPPTRDPADNNVAKVMEASLKIIILNIDQVVDKVKCGGLSIEAGYKELRSIDSMWGLVIKTIEAGGDPNIKKLRYGATPLHLAHFLKRDDLIESLTKLGATPSPNRYGVYPENLHGILEYAPTPPSAVISEKTPEEILAEKSAELKELMARLPRLSAKAGDKEGEVGRMIYLIEETATDVNILTKDNWSALHLAARFGTAAQVETLLKKEIKIDAKAKVGNKEFTALDLAISQGNKDVIDELLKAPSLSLQMITESLKLNNDPKIFKHITANQNVAEKVVDLDKGQRANKVSELHALVKTFTPANKKIAVEGLKIFEENIKQVALPEKVKTPKKDALEKSAQQIKKSVVTEFEKEILLETLALAQKEVQEEKAAAEDVLIQESTTKVENQVFDEITEEVFQQEIASAVAKKIAEENTIKKIAGEIEEKIISEVIAEEILQEQKIAIESKQMAGEDKDAAPSRLEKLHDERKQMEKFLSGPRQINSLADLPKFLQQPLDKLLQVGCGVVLKGSALYLPSYSKRQPSDLDIEVFVPKIKDWPEEQIRKFLQEDCDLEPPSKLPIFVKKKKDEKEVFTLGIKDNIRKVDWAFYDADHKYQEVDHLSWIVAPSEKMYFDSAGYAHYQDYSRPLEINPRAHSLILNLSFYLTIGCYNSQELVDAISLSVKEQPLELLCKEFRLDKPEFLEKWPQIIDNKISHFMQSHNLSPEEQLAFVHNLGYLANVRVMAPPNPKLSKQCDVLRDELGKQLAKYQINNYQLKEVGQDKGESVSPSPATVVNMAYSPARSGLQNTVY